MVYQDFEIEITADSVSGYWVRADSTLGNARQLVDLPLTPLALENRLQAVELALLRSSGARRRVLGDAEQTVRAFGEVLFNMVFDGEVRTLYDLNRRAAGRAEQGLRLRLIVEPPQLARLPWEFLYDPRDGEFLTLSRSTPVVRYVETHHPEWPLAVQPPLHILGMIASPRGWPELDVVREQQRVEKAVARLQLQSQIDLVWLEGQSWRALQAAMRGGPWHVFHFIGHGGFDPDRDEGTILLADDEGNGSPLTATQLARLLADHPSLRFVFLNACEGATGSDADGFSSCAATLVRRSVPAVLAMQYAISDGAAVEFSRSFYEALADGEPVDLAVVEARKAMSLAAAGSPEWGTPVLIMNTPDGRLFEVQSPLTSETISSPDVSPSEPFSPPVYRQPLRRTFAFVALALLLLAALTYVVFNRTQPDGSDTVISSPTSGSIADVLSTMEGAVTAIATSTLPATQPTQTPSTFTAVSDAPFDEPILLHVNFDTADAVAAPAAGIGGAGMIEVADLVDGSDGPGVYFGEDSTVVAFPIARDGQRNISFARGSVDLHYRPDYANYAVSERSISVLLVADDWYSSPRMALTAGRYLGFQIELAGKRYGVRSDLDHQLWDAGEWVHIQAVWDTDEPEDAIQLYVNGERVNSERVAGGWDADGLSNLRTLYIGSGSKDGVLPADGVIDELIVRGSAGQNTAVSTATPDWSQTDGATPADPVQAAVLTRQGVDALAAGDPQTALQHFTQAIEADPALVQAYVGRGQAHRELGDFSAALVDLDKAIALDGANVRAYQERGHAYAQRANTEESPDVEDDRRAALADFEEAIELGAEDPYLYILRAEVHKEMGDFDLALSGLDEGIETVPEPGELYGSKAAIYSEMGDYEQALATLSEGIEAFPEEHELRASRAFLYKDLGLYEMAIADLTAVLRQNPTPDLYTCRAQAYHALDNVDAAIDDYRKVLEFADPEDDWDQHLRQEAQAYIEAHSE